MSALLVHTTATVVGSWGAQKSAQTLMAPLPVAAQMALNSLAMASHATVSVSLNSGWIHNSIKARRSSQANFYYAAQHMLQHPGINLQVTLRLSATKYNILSS
jgi:hypothetical protein